MTVLTDGFDLYVRIRPGVYGRTDRQGRRCGGVHTDFSPPVRWQPAVTCDYDQATTLRCSRCRRHDDHYAMTGHRSCCAIQHKALALIGED
jgi:hypothetical protein